LQGLGVDVADVQLPDLEACELESACQTEPIESGEESEKPQKSHPDNS
jgi:hypothetical protein